MTKITEQICLAFERGEVKRISNSFTDGMRLYLFDNLIAEHREDGLYITNAGWQTKTTKERLNGLSGVYINQSKKKWYLNGEEWDGEWTRVNTNPPPAVDMEAHGEAWNYSKQWVARGYRGYEKPLYAVCGANDTGRWDDSPCPTDIAYREIREASAALSESGIATKQMTCETSNVFCVHHYVIVRPKDKAKAEEVIEQYLQQKETRLLYDCK